LVVLGHERDGAHKRVEEFESKQSAAEVCVGARSDMSIEALGRTFREHVFYTQGRFPKGASRNDL
jgi:hypothetical protein